MVAQMIYGDNLSLEGRYSQTSVRDSELFVAYKNATAASVNKPEGFI